LLLGAACSRQPSVQTVSQPVPSGHGVPFDSNAGKAGISPTAALTPAQIPAGTALTIRLHSALSSAEAHLGDSFEGVLDEPIAWQGQTLVPKGTEIVGKVLDAKAFDGLHEPGYLRLTLLSIVIQGKLAILQTSSLFAKGEARRAQKSGGGNAALMSRVIVGDPASSGVREIRGREDVMFSTERRLTFRLLQPLQLQD